MKYMLVFLLLLTSFSCSQSSRPEKYVYLTYSTPTNEEKILNLLSKNNINVELIGGVMTSISVAEKDYEKARRILLDNEIQIKIISPKQSSDAVSK